MSEYIKNVISNNGVQLQIHQNYEWIILTISATENLNFVLVWETYLIILMVVYTSAIKNSWQRSNDDMGCQELNIGQ